MILFCAAYARDAEKPMPYLDKLLTAYHTQGITTPDQVEAARSTFAAEAASNRPAAPAPRRQGKVVGTSNTLSEPTNPRPHGCSRR